MRLIAILIMMITLSSSIIPCHAGEHDHGSECSHHEDHHSSEDSNSEDDHPCSPFCMHHFSFFTEKSNDVVTSACFALSIQEIYLFNYQSSLSELCDYSFWHPPQA